VESDLGFVVGGSEVVGALSTAAISEADIANARYDGASVEFWLVDWTSVDARVLIDAGVVGEIKRTEHAFNAEVRSLATLLDQPFGRFFQSGCSADLGDARCAVDTTAAAYRATGTIDSTDGRLLFSLPLAGFDDGWFANGVATFTSGANAGRKLAVKSHVATATHANIALWTALDGDIAVGDGVELTAGCDKRLATCAAKFANQVNFRGFPHIPGLDALLSYANSNSPNMDGGSLFQNAPSIGSVP
jgi:uncharacterized phage protein (TIGR02218 family)